MSKPHTQSEPHVADVTYRTEPKHNDIGALRGLVGDIDVFYPEEREVAMELLEERMLLGAASGYHFILADVGDALAGYTAWGPVPLTESSFDLYWIAVHPTYRHLGLGRELMRLTEEAVAARGGGRLYIETSSREAYRHTRDFYTRAGYLEVGYFDDFYAPQDAKVVYCKRIEGVGT
jgi:ribosomal protein S18 acetylase RimI-like enzyme